MTKEEAKAYAQRLLKEGGASDEDVTRLTAAFDNDKFFNGFVPRPEVDRALSTERGKYTEFQTRNKYLEEEWLPQAKAAYEKNVKGIKMLEKYQELYGAIDLDDPADVRKVVKESGLSKEEVAEILKNEFASRDRATLDLMDIREHHLDTFKKRLDLDAFEAHVAKERQRGNLDSVKSIYNQWVSPEIEKLTPHRFSEADLAARDKRIKEEAYKDYASRKSGTGPDAKPRESHLLFDNARIREEQKKANGSAQSGRDAFLEVMSDPEPDTVKQRYPVA